MTERKIRILFVFYTQDLVHKAHASELMKMHYIGPLNETGLADHDIFWYGPWMTDDWITINWRLFYRCMKYQPDVIMVYNGWQPDYHPQGLWFPRLFCFYLIRKLLGVKVSAFFTDQAYDAFKISDNLIRFCDIAFAHGHEDLFRTHSSFPKKYITTPAVYSPKLFHSDPLNKRYIDLAFVGQINGYCNERVNGIEALRRNGLIVSTPGGQGEGQNFVSVEAYTDFHKRSKIIINWSRHMRGGWVEAKGRIFETTLSGAMLLCEECAPVNRWFLPYVDYVPFSTTEELVEKANYYLDHEEERLKIAVQGHRTAMAKYTADVVWDQRLQYIQGKSFYREAEAIEGLRRNASSNELQVARFFKKELHEYPQFNQLVIDEAVGIVEKANRSFVRKLNRRIQRTRRLVGSLEGLHWRILRKLLPSFITRKNVKAVLRSFYS
jgi:spore maturation protein CgeB